MKKNKGDLIFGITVAVATVLILGSFFIFKDKFQKPDDGSVYTQDTVYEIDINNEPMLGDPEAPVTIVEFGDFKCPACGYFANSIVPAIQSEYIDTGKANLVFKNFPFIYEDSTRSAIFTEGVLKELGNEDYWKLNKAIYEHQNEIYTQNDLSNEKKDVYTEKFLLDTSKELFGKEKSDKLKEILENKEFKNEVNNDLDEAKKVQVSGTPTVFVNGKRVYDSLNYEAVKGAIEEALNSGDQNVEKN